MSSRSTTTSSSSSTAGENDSAARTTTSLRSTPAAAAGSGSNGPKGDNKNTNHYHFIHSMILPSTIKIQRELKSRKFKEVQIKLTETIELLQQFQLEKWEPEKVPEKSKVPRRSRGSNNAAAVVSDEATTATEMTEETADEKPPAGGEANFANFDESPAEKDPNEVEDDPLTRMKVHKAVSVALEAYMMTISHPLMNRSSSKAACEQALACIEQLVIREYVGGRAGGRDDNSASGAVAMKEQRGGGNLEDASEMHRLLEALHDCSESALKMPIIHSHISRCIRAILTSPRCGIHESSMLFGIRITFHSYLVTNNDSCRKAAKEALLDIVEYYLQRLERDKARGSSSLWYTDCFHMMRSLIKLSSKEIPGIDENTSTTAAPKQNFFWSLESTQTANPVALHNKILSLELQRRAIECAGPVFCNGDKFIQLIQSQNGSIALFKNCMSQCTQVAYISQQVFLIMCYKFKHHIKDEMQAFMSNIFFRVLESQNSNCTQKALVLESLRSLCKDPFLLSQIFLNYDCDMGSENLYKDIVFHLGQLCARSTMKVAELEARGGRAKQKEADEYAELSLAGCEVLVTILRAFLEALNIQTNDDEEEEIIIDTIGKKIRKDLSIEDIVASVKRRSSTFVRFRQDKKKGADVVRSSLVGGAIATSPSDGSESVTEGDDDPTGTILEFFEKKRNAEQNLELGVVKFTMDLKKGLRFFIDNGFVSCDAQEMAQFFLLHKDRLDKTQLGEVLGREPDSAFIKGQPDLDPEKGGPGFFVRILHHYTNAMDFTDMFFAEAIRLFLSGFRLPGEAQKIDRIMEKFAERFTAQNPEVFPSADTAFILAFSVIMLNTDLHNPSIKPERRMTIESFIRNNRGIGKDGADLDPVFLTKIFNRIKEKPFSLKEDDAAREAAEKTESANTLLGDNGILGPGLFGTTAEERKKEKFKKEQEDMVTATELLIRRKKGRTAKAENLTDAVDPAHVVKPMFDVTWGAIIGTLSQVMEFTNDEQAIAVCLTGFVYAIRISAHSNMSLARDAFLGTLAKFTYLGSVKELKYKNIEVIRTIINIAVTDGDYLGESWGPVLQCISQLARMRISASGLDNDEAFLQDSTHSGTSEAAKKDAGNNRSMFARETKADVLKEMETTNSRIVLNAISEQLIDQVFSSSVKLSAQSLALFIEQLIAVSNSEIEGDSKSGITGVSTSNAGSSHGEAGPSIFSMQRLVEVADYNMHARPRLVWAQIWGLMADFFSKNGCHENSMVSVFAVDALKQLSLKFLEKAEASEFHFQRMFLEPFLVIMKNEKSLTETREIILACVDQMIHSRVENLKSGWRVFFDIITVGANDPNNKVSLHALSILQGTLDKHLNKLSIFAEKDDTESGKANRNADAEDFLAMCKASLSFMSCKKPNSSKPLGVSMRALCHAAIYADLIASKRILPPISGAQSEDPEAPGYSYEGLSEEETLEMVLWRSLFEGLAEGAKSTAKSREDGIGNFIQRGSVLALRVILLRHGTSFSDSQLKMVLTDTIIPAFVAALESDSSPVVSIASESPSISSLDFLVEPFPLPPECDDEGLLKFEHVCQQSERNPRSMGPAELLLEATFTDMRNGGGGGDLSEVYKFAKKDMESKHDGEQPFPDSWISTTAPIALGTLTDLSSEILFARGAEGAEVWRSTVGAIYLQWCNGDITRWVPCEAVMRIATSELDRFMKRATSNLSTVAKKEDANAWANQVVEFYTEAMGRNLGLAKEMMDMLLESKCENLNDDGAKSLSSVTESEDNGSSSSESSSEEEVSYGDESSSSSEESKEDGTHEEAPKENEASPKEISDKNEQSSSSDVSNEKWVSLEVPNENESPTDDKENPPVKAEPKAEKPEGIEEDEETKPAIVITKVDVRTFYPSNMDKEARLPVETLAKLDERYNTPDSPDWMKLLPALKLRCVAAHCLQQILLSLREEELVGFISHETVSKLLKILNASRELAEDATKNEHLAHAFKEAMFSEWGISEDMGEEALENVARLNQTQGSAMFFLTQTAGATNGVIRLLTALYDHEETFHGEDNWDRRAFAGQYLVAIMEDIFRKFTESEAKEGHKVNPNVWRNSSESGVKVAIYCTSFASVVVGLLEALLSFEPALIDCYKGAFYPLVCELVGVRSEEIRKLVRRVLTEKFGPLLGLGQDTGGRRSIRLSLSQDSNQWI